MVRFTDLFSLVIRRSSRELYLIVRNVRFTLGEETFADFGSW